MQVHSNKLNYSMVDQNVLLNKNIVPGTRKDHWPLAIGLSRSCNSAVLLT